MKRKRKQYSGAFKAKVGLEALIGMKTTAQIARENQVHPLLVGQWKTLLRERMRIPMQFGQRSDFSRTVIRFKSDAVPMQIGQRSGE